MIPSLNSECLTIYCGAGDEERIKTRPLMDKVKAQKHLAQANKIVEEGNARIKRQKERVEELVAEGHKTKNAKATLKSLQNLEETHGEIQGSYP
jgi:hypothetical protein